MLLSIYELAPRFDSRKSFYGKAHVLVYDDGTLALKSYDTIVSKYIDGKVIHLGKWSQTTSRHQREFERQIEVGQWKDTLIEQYTEKEDYNDPARFEDEY